MLAVSLVTLGDPGTLTGGYLYHRRVAAYAADNDAALQFASFPRWPFPLAAAAGRRVFAATTTADVIVLDSIAAGLAAPWAAALAAPLVGMLHQPPGGIDHGRWRANVQGRLDRRVYARCCRLLVASDALAADLLAAGMAPELLRVIAPGRDPAPAAGERLGDLRRGARMAVLSVGNWVPRKGLLDLLAAVAVLPAGTLTLHLVGDTEADRAYARRVRARLAHPDLADRVVVHGAMPPDRVPAFYAAADAFALASAREPYGTVYGEAMAAGLPVVGWRAGNLPHLARDGVDGFAVSPGDRPALAAALARLADDEALRARMGVAAAERAATFPTWADTARRLFGELRAAVGGAG